MEDNIIFITGAKTNYDNYNSSNTTILYDDVTNDYYLHDNNEKVDWIKIGSIV